MSEHMEPLSGRLDEAILDRFLTYADRIVALTEQLEDQRRSRRVVDQFAGSGTSPAAQMFEAHEALSAADFVKSVGIATKELSETRFWLKLVIRRGWISAARLADLLDETTQLMLITKAMRARTRFRKPKP